MIRPVTLVCMLMAGGSGLYLYQSKHQAQMLDRKIGETIKATEQTRERIKILDAEWTMLTQPERLAELARAHLALRPIDPTRWRTVEDISHLLPAPVATPKPAEPEAEPMPAIAQAAPQAVAAAPVRPVSVAVAVPQLAEPKIVESKPAESKQAAAEPKQTPARPVPHPRPAPVQVAAAPVVPAPRAMVAPVLPVAASNAATAPGTVGEAVLRAMRANMTAAPAPQQVHYATPQPAYAPPAYAAPVVAAPVYATPAYAPQATSLLGSSRGSLPPPVPFAAR